LGMPHGDEAAMLHTLSCACSGSVAHSTVALGGSDALVLLGWWRLRRPGPGGWRVGPPKPEISLFPASLYAGHDAAASDGCSWLRLRPMRGAGGWPLGPSSRCRCAYLICESLFPWATVTGHDEAADDGAVSKLATTKCAVVACACSSTPQHLMQCIGLPLSTCILGV